MLLDTNVLLDIILQRDPFYEAAARLWLRIEAGDVEGLVSLTSLDTIFYLVRKSADRAAAKQALATICRVLKVPNAPGEAARAALQSNMPDFEDALQYAIACAAGADCVVTRNPADFPKRGTAAVLTPEQLLERLDA